MECGWDGEVKRVGEKTGWTVEDCRSWTKRADQTKQTLGKVGAYE